MTNPLTTTDEIETMGFAKVGDWSLCQSRSDKGGVDCKRRSPADPQPCVYLVVSETAGAAEVLYVGMGSNGWWRRIRMHLGNWDRPFHTIIAERLGAGARVSTYWKTSDWLTIHDRRTSLCGAEEMALIARFQPLLNASKDKKRTAEWQKA
ncbi:hypothetical protein [Brevundimonas sp.]|uniref:hypothetical protein n=1 Tax=Brevundimonas sp. TaxID=1871086 RepID=UPI0026231984|nr:hypothetical protein [Brevundimonas sp.]